MEILYLSEKHRIKINLAETLKKIYSSSIYSIVNLTPEILEVAETIEFSELHDRLIIATAKWLGISIISSDQEFPKIDGLETIWN